MEIKLLINSNEKKLFFHYYEVTDSKIISKKRQCANNVQKIQKIHDQKAPQYQSRRLFEPRF